MYQRQQGALTVAKTLTGRDMSAGEFTFAITGGDEAHAVPAVDAEFTNDKGTADGVASEMTGKLGSLTFTQDDIGKTFTYTVTESGDVAGVTNDPEASKTFEVAVTDNGDGTISVSGPTSAAFTFVNTYACLLYTSRGRRA